jgi:hypothetical protein
MRVLRFLAILAILVPVSAAFADKPGPPMTYTKTSPNKQFLFVMVSPDSLEEEVKRYNEDAAKKVRAIRTTYPKSGLYKNDGSKEPLWTVDWFRGSVIVPSDGVHLVSVEYTPPSKVRRNDPLPKESLQQPALSFFAKGKLLRSYEVADLVDRPEQLSRSVSHFRWMKEHNILDQKQQLEVITYDGNNVLFDLKTGDIVKKTRVDPKQ